MTDLTPKPEGHPIKIVRDRTPGVVNPSGEPGALFYGPLPPAQGKSGHARFLRLKLAEEVAEYLVDGTLAELADALAVIEGLARVWHEVSLDELIEAMRSDARGGFVEGVMMYGFHPEFDGRDR